MYLKLGTTTINYVSDQDDFIILSQIVPSDVGFHKPVFVRTTDELDIWFGRDFKGYGYLQELIRQGVTLYLYRPILDQVSMDVDDYIDYSGWPESTTIYYNTYELPKIGETGILYTMYNRDIYIWYEELADYVKISDLPQNIAGDNSISLSNRDTLRIIDSRRWTYPKYNYKLTSRPAYKEDITDLLEWPDLEQVDLGYQSLALDLSYTPTTLSETPWIIIKTSDGANCLVWFKTVDYNTLPTGKDGKLGNYYSTIKEVDISTVDPDDYLAVITKAYKELGYSVSGSTVYANFPVLINHFYSFPGFEATQDLIVTENILSAITEDSWGIELISKTIGIAGENIKVVSEKTTSSEYRIYLSRYDYSEVFEGSTVLEIVNLINSNSNLVFASLGNTGDLPEGAWELKRAVTEVYSASSYWKALEYVINPESPVYLDYFLIPKVSDWITKADSNYLYYPEYKTLIKYAESQNCQILIQNTTGKEGDWAYNYTKDFDNRLIYFYGDLELRYGLSRPGYYVYLKGLLQNSYSMEVSDIVYVPPVSNPYEESNEIEETLGKYKCNYLVDNGHIYYYKDYQNGDSYNSTGWMRFCLGKVERELQKYKWEYVSYRTVGSLRTRIEQIISKISNTFTIIRSLNITNFEASYEDSSASITIETYMSDLVDNNMSIDITLNYNN